MGSITDAEVDAWIEALEALSDDDLEQIVRDHHSDLTYLRPRPLAVLMAREILRLRRQVRALTAEILQQEGQE